MSVLQRKTEDSFLKKTINKEGMLSCSKRINTALDSENSLRYPNTRYNET